ncbi:DUF6769 family protein [Roseimarinus sediminis]|uniref:DUF6769 family protein n=1 Tax=Roseimarinus sediminis TaxID=1610899 RepID=UPI003D20F96A
MLRKKAAILFLLIANSVILAHAFVPHHHHYEKVCIVTSNSECEDENHQNHHSDHQKGHDHHKGEEACLLKKASAILSNSGVDRNNFLSLILIDLPDEHAVLPQQNLIPEFLKHNYESVTPFYSNKCVKSFGLRAPPVA